MCILHIGGFGGERSEGRDGYALPGHQRKPRSAAAPPVPRPYRQRIRLRGKTDERQSPPFGPRGEGERERERGGEREKTREKEYTHISV